MADYYTLIKRAVGRLDPAEARDGRLALYERAREAQLSQLLAISPALSEREIACEQMALEEAVGTVEAEFVQPSRNLSIPTAVSDLLLAAENIGKPVSDAGPRSALVSTRRRAERLSDAATHDTMRPMMMVSGAATARLSRYWRWRSSIRGGLSE